MKVPFFKIILVAKKNIKKIDKIVINEIDDFPPSKYSVIKRFLSAENSKRTTKLTDILKKLFLIKISI